MVKDEFENNFQPSLNKMLKKSTVGGAIFTWTGRFFYESAYNLIIPSTPLILSTMLGHILLDDLFWMVFIQRQLSSTF